jgi:diguanylate cyclase (GGDEF)-like protein
MQARDVRNHALHDMGEMLQNCTSVGEAWAVLKRYMPRLLPAAAGRFHASQGHEPYEVAVGWGDDASGTFALGADDCWALRLGRAHVSERGDALRCGHLPPDATRSHLCVPVSGQGRTVGLLHFDGLEHREDAALLHDTLLAWGTTIAENLGLALSNLELREKLRVQAMRDALTGLYNRRYLEEALARELRRSARSQRPLSLLIVDIDHFKQVNDRHGHDVGDEVLCAVAHLLESTARAEDVVCRLGGEEFVVISPEADVGGGAVLAERLRGAVRALEGAALPAALTQPVTVSIGVASAPQHAADAAALLKAADAALYDAKRAGRDRVGLATGAAGVV